jgi:hypothetical protein
VREEFDRLGGYGRLLTCQRNHQGSRRLAFQLARDPDFSNTSFARIPEFESSGLRTAAFRRYGRLSSIGLVRWSRSRYRALQVLSSKEHAAMLDSISAVTLATHDMARGRGTSLAPSISGLAVAFLDSRR